MNIKKFLTKTSLLSVLLIIAACERTNSDVTTVSSTSHLTVTPVKDEFPHFIGIQVLREDSSGEQNHNYLLYDTSKTDLIQSQFFSNVHIKLTERPNQRTMSFEATYHTNQSEDSCHVFSALLNDPDQLALTPHMSMCSYITATASWVIAEEVTILPSQTKVDEISLTIKVVDIDELESYDITQFDENGYLVHKSTYFPNQLPDDALEIKIDQNAVKFRIVKTYYDETGSKYNETIEYTVDELLSKQVIYDSTFSVQDGVQSIFTVKYVSS